MSKDRSLRQRAVEAYREQNQRNADKMKDQFQKTFATQPDHVSVLIDEHILIETNGLLIRSWLTANDDYWYALVSRCTECGNIFDCASSIGNAWFGDLLGLGKALEALGEDYKPEIVCRDCMRTYRE